MTDVLGRQARVRVFVFGGGGCLCCLSAPLCASRVGSARALAARTRITPP